MNEFDRDKSMTGIKQNYLEERTKAFALTIVRLLEGLLGD